MPYLSHFSLPTTLANFEPQSWCDLFGYEVSKVLGQTCKMLQGKDTEMDRIAEIMTGVKVRITSIRHTP